MLQVNNLARRTARYRSLIDAAFKRVADSGWFVLGPEVRGFETQFAAYIGVGHCVGVANGTDAIRLALQAVGVKAGEQVATVANAGMYSTTAMLSIGAKPLFMDVDALTHNVTPAEVERAIAAGAKAIIVTHLYGRAVAEIGPIAALCRAKDVRLIEDCAQAHGCTVDGRKVGSFGDAASFSFYPTKNLGALGDGGAVVTNDAAMAERLRRLRQYGWSSKYAAEVPGGSNSRLDEVQAAILSAFLPQLDADNARRRAIADRYTRGIKASVVLPTVTGADYVAHLYVLTTPKRDALRRHLEHQKVGSDIHYPIPDHRQAVFANAYAAVRLPTTETLAQTVLTLPCYPELTDDEADQVIEAVNGWAA